MFAQAAEPPIGRDIQPLHDLRGTYRANPRQGFQHVDHLGVSNNVVGLGKDEDLLEAALARAKSLLHLGAAASSLGRCMSGLLTLLVAQRGYRHSSRPHLAARQFLAHYSRDRRSQCSVQIRRNTANQSEI
jgi:hypothetical protein